MNVRKVFFVLCFFSFFLFGVKGFSYVYYIPHIHTGTDSWETYLVLDNSFSQELDGSIYYYDQDGHVIQRENFTVHPYNNKTISLRNKGAVAAMVYTGSSFLRVRLGYIAKDSLGGGTAEFSPPTKLSRRLLMNTSNYYDKLTWSGFALWNGTDKEVEVTLKAYSEEERLEIKTITLQPYQKIVDFFDSFFGVASFKDIVSVTIDTDYPALCGVVISGKDNDKLLFSSPLMPDYFMNHTEKIPGIAYATNIVFTSEDGKFHSFVYSHNEGLFFHEAWGIYGVTEPLLENGVDYNMDIQYIAPSEDEDAIYLFGVSGENYKVVKIDVTGDDHNEWQTVLGRAVYSTPFFPDPQDVKIRGVEKDGKVFLFYKDGDNDHKGTFITLNASNGAKLSEHGNLTNTVQYGDMLSYTLNNHNYVAETFAYYTDKLQIRIYDYSGNLTKQIYGDSPIPDSENKSHLVFGSLVLGNKMLMVVGTGIDINMGVRQYHLYLVSVNLETDTDFSNATVTDLQTFLIHGSSCFLFQSLNFSSSYKNKVSYDKTLEIITKPYSYNYGYNDTSTTLLVHLNDDNSPVDYPYFKRKLPYLIHGVGFGDMSIYTISTDTVYLTLEPFNAITNVNIRFLFTYDLLNY